MSKSTISTFQLFEMFPDQETARVYLEGRLWPNGPRCPVCGLGERITARKGGFYRCNQCKEDFTVRTGTIFERSHVPLHKWIYAMYLLVTARKGISSMQLAKEIGITQKSAWFVLHRLARGVRIEARNAARHRRNRRNLRRRQRDEQARVQEAQGRSRPGRQDAVLGMRERGGRTVAMPIERCRHGDDPSRHSPARRGRIDDPHRRSGAYTGIDIAGFDHETVNHSAGEYVRGDVTTNGIESVFAVFKRGLIGVYHHASPKHLGPLR